jgi:hypothetical protein
MRFSGRNVVTVMLIVVMTTPALSSPALLHSHADGNKPHSHHAPVVAHHEHSHSHGQRHSHSSRHHHRAGEKAAKHSHDVPATNSATPPTGHYHVYWFGFTVSLPLPTPQHPDSQRTMPNLDQWVPLVSDIRLPDSVPDGSSVVLVDLCTPTELTPRLPDRSEAQPLRRCPIVLLCDTARRERSGVLVV